MRIGLLCLLAALLLLSGCTSVKEFFFPNPSSGTGREIGQTTNERRRLERYEDRQNARMRDERKGRSDPILEPVPPVP